MKAIFKTKSNFRNTNGIELKVIEIIGTRITAIFNDEIIGEIKIDFHLSEVVKFTKGFVDNPIYGISFH